MRFVLFVAFLVLKNAGAEQQPLYRPIVTTPLGKIEGHVGLTLTMNPFYKFEGVPYAKPPVGELRFENPEDPEPWTGIWKANVLTRCLQYDHFTQDMDNNYVVHGDEDCLYVNIYTHSTSKSANKDVLVHIHGGAFMFGRGASYGPEIIMDRDIVFVNFNYRLGPLGFLSTEDNVLPGNLGLRDQIKALQWVKQNIKYFGGNPDSITLHGLSAGGASVHLHYLMPASTGLFKQGISQSGCALNPWVLIENIREKTLKLGDIIGCPQGSSQEIKQCFKSKPAQHIVQAVKEFQPFLYNPFSPFAVSVDGHWADDPVLPDHPYKLLQEGKVQDLPWIVSYTSAEGLYPGADFWSDEVLQQIDHKWNEVAPFILHYNDSVDPEFMDVVSQKIRQKYMGDGPVNKDSFHKLINAISDRLFVADISTAARLQSAVAQSNVFCYSYNYRGTMSISSLIVRDNTNIGVSHGDDTLLLLKMKYDFPIKDILSTDDDKLMSKLLVELTVTFMKTGGTDIEWEPLSKDPSDPFNVLIIDNHHELRMQKQDDIISDRLFIADLETSARLHSQATSSDIFTYTFDYRGQKSKSSFRTNSDVNLGVAHGDDTIYVLYNGLDTLSTDEDRLMSELMKDMVLSFMTTGKPGVTSRWFPVEKSANESFNQLKILGPDRYEMRLMNEVGQRSWWDGLDLNENVNYVYKRDNFKDEL